MPPVVRTFTCHGARSKSWVVTICAVAAVETVALHLLLVRHHPILAWLLTLSSASLVVWLIGDYRAMRDAAVRIEDDTVRLDFGWRLRETMPRSAIVGAASVEWRDTPASERYINLTKPAQCNLVLILREPRPLRLFGAVRRPVRRLGLHVDDPGAVLEAFGVSQAHPDALPITQSG